MSVGAATNAGDGCEDLVRNEGDDMHGDDLDNDCVAFRKGGVSAICLLREVGDLCIKAWLWNQKRHDEKEYCNESEVFVQLGYRSEIIGEMEVQYPEKGEDGKNRRRP